MRLSDLVQIDKQLKLIRDANFDTFAQCIVDLNQKFVTFLDDEKYINYLSTNTSISAVICNKQIIEKIPSYLGIIVSEEPRYDFFRIYNLFMEYVSKPLTKTIIGDNFSCGMNTSISPYGVTIGKNVSIGDNVVIKAHTQIGDNVTILSGCIIGEEGFEVKRKADKTLFPVKHYGKTIIGNNTIFKSLVSMHRAVFEWDATYVGDNCVIDSMTHIAHGAKVYDKVLIGSNTSLCGNCRVMDEAYLGPNVSIRNRIIVGKGAKVSIGSVATQNVPEGHIVTGNFAVEHEKWIKFVKEL